MKTCKLPGRLQLVVLSIVMSCFALPAQAVDVGVVVGAGTLGSGLNVSFGVSERFNARLGLSQFEDSAEFDDSDLEFEGDVTLGGIYALADFFPFNGVFHLSGGLVRNNNELTGKAGITDNIEIGDDTYTVDNLSAKVDFDDIAPYLGIGWSNAARGDGGFTASFDVGILFQGAANVDLNASGGDADNPAFEDDLRREEAQLEDELSESVNVEAYPLVALFLGWTF